jgi:hypothetical protein
MAKEILVQSYKNKSTNKKSRTSSVTGIVIDVILDDDTSPDLSINDTDNFSTSKDTRFVGCVLVKKTKSLESSFKYTGEPIPPFNTDEDLPLKNEEVELIKLGNSLYYKRLNSTDLNVGNAFEGKTTRSFKADEKESPSGDYSSTSSTGTSKSSATDNDEKIGKYFEPTQVNRLLKYEGDKIIESRFGQSIRFSGYNNQDEELSPTIIIRNRQNSESLSKLKRFDSVEEDVNKDGSTILLSSNKYKIDFQPGTVDDGGSSDFETNPINFELPQEYTGFDQMLLSSERIILSAKSQEMIFFSKGNYGFISDGKFTIDNGNGGADLDFGDDVNITTDRNNGNFSVNTGNGNILLNTDNTNEAIVRGNTLVDLLTQLIDAINQQTFNTPSGPTALGPNNRATFNDIKSKLRDALSTLNFTE